MIVSNVIGGMGNQLFQYAAARLVSDRLRDPLKLDLSGFENYPLRKLELHKFKITYQAATPEELLRFQPVKPVWKQKFREFRGAPRHIQEKADYHVDPRLYSSSGDLYFQGFWQCWQYLSPIESRIRAEFIPRREPSGMNADLLSELRAVPSVMVHVRRGDYVNHAYTAGFHGSCSPEYYLEASKRILAVEPSAQFYVFSDDPEWCKENLKLPGLTRYVDHNGTNEAEEDLRLMAACRHHIIANSSFSWWGAWLANQTGQLVFAPRRWLATSKIEVVDLIPPTWEQL